MNLLERFKQFIRNDNLDDEKDYVSVNSEQSEVGSPQLAVDNVPLSVLQSAVLPTEINVPQQIYEVPESSVQPLPHWLENEDALRDEGVIFGLSESKAEEKIAIIRSVFEYQTADLEKEIEEKNEKIGELNLFIEQKEVRINELTDKTRLLEEKETVSHQLPRTLAGLLLSLAMCVGNYFLISETLKNSYQQNYQFIGIGVFLAGMFNLFGSISFFHEKDTSISRRKILEEIGMPLAASFFVFIHALETQSVWRSLALLFFVFFLFLFAGKLLLSNMTVTKDDLSKWLKNVRLNNDKVNKSADWEDEIQKLKSEIDELRVKKWEIIPILNKRQAELNQTNGRRDALIKIFESEFNLARSYRDKLTAKQIRAIAP